MHQPHWLVHIKSSNGKIELCISQWRQGSDEISMSVVNEFWLKLVQSSHLLVCRTVSTYSCMILKSMVSCFLARRASTDFLSPILSGLALESHYWCSESYEREAKIMDRFVQRLQETAIQVHQAFRRHYLCFSPLLPSYEISYLFMLVHGTKIFLKYIIFASSRGSEKEPPLHSLIALETRFKSPGAGSHKSLIEDTK